MDILSIPPDKFYSFPLISSPSIHHDKGTPTQFPPDKGTPTKSPPDKGGKGGLSIYPIPPTDKICSSISPR